MARHAVTGGSRKVSTCRVDHRSTEPRVGSSNLSGRAESSQNRKNTRESGFVARGVALGLSEADARKLLSRLRLIVREYKTGRRTACATVEAGIAAGSQAYREAVAS